MYWIIRTSRCDNQSIFIDKRNQEEWVFCIDDMISDVLAPLDV